MSNQSIQSHDDKLNQLILEGANYWDVDDVLRNMSEETESEEVMRNWQCMSKAHPSGFRTV